MVLSEHSLASEEGFEQVFDVDKIFVHYNYNYRTFNNDIMLIKVRPYSPLFKESELSLGCTSVVMGRPRDCCGVHIQKGNMIQLFDYILYRCPAE